MALRRQHRNEESPKIAMRWLGFNFIFEIMWRCMEMQCPGDRSEKRHLIVSHRSVVQSNWQGEALGFMTDTKPDPAARTSRKPVQPGFRISGHDKLTLMHLDARWFKRCRKANLPSQRWALCFADTHFNSSLYGSICARLTFVSFRFQIHFSNSEKICEILLLCWCTDAQFFKTLSWCKALILTCGTRTAEKIQRFGLFHSFILLHGLFYLEADQRGGPARFKHSQWECLVAWALRWKRLRWPGVWREAPGLASRSLIILIGQPRHEKQADCAETNWKLTRPTPRKMFYHVIPIWIELAFDKD